MTDNIRLEILKNTIELFLINNFITYNVFSILFFLM